jgi:hypothetical protein
VKQWEIWTFDFDRGRNTAAEAPTRDLAAIATRGFRNALAFPGGGPLLHGFPAPRQWVGEPDHIVFH